MSNKSGLGFCQTCGYYKGKHKCHVWSVTVSEWELHETAHVEDPEDAAISVVEDYYTSCATPEVIEEPVEVTVEGEGGVFRFNVSGMSTGEYEIEVS